MFVFGGILFIFIGISMMLNPKFFWELNDQWKSKDGTEPSDLYIFNKRIGGIICTVVGVILLLIKILS
ncbi:hypothetical protein BK133_30320 [Paenibacillus sp. FSL H8-0548]|uniref:DUF6199 family natural product biosynthesis protein n=1 Tax=Paenibacillus sp. FSL H8-0548 TaxID=1920422 RepID=UPI00096CAD00|nr:hypothetical protein BK133_30320 [Paenibacillus sp. FSL H8-0548]